MSAILAIDPGIHMGWALLKGNGKVSFGQETFKQSRNDRQGSAFSSFTNG